MKDATVILWTDNDEGTKQAAPYLAGIAKESIARFVVAPPGTDIDASIWGGDWTPIFDDNQVRGVCEAIGQAGAETVNIFRSDVMLSPIWRQVASMGCAQWHGVGCAGPQLSGSQYIRVDDDILRAGFGATIQHLSGKYAGRFARADWLDPVALTLHVKRLEGLGGLDPELGDLGWALRDYAVRVREAGGGFMIAPAAYAQILDRKRLSAWDDGDIDARLRYYAKHNASTAPQQLTASWTVQPGSRHQLSLLLQSAASVVDRVDMLHFALVAHPKAFLEGEGTPLHRGATKLQAMAKIEDEQEACRAWAEWLRKALKLDRDKLVVSWVPPGWASLQHLENSVTRDLKKLGATWCLKMTEGDLLDAACTRKQLDRLMAHPDPMVVAYNVSIQFCWESDELLRDDPPYGDGGSLRGDGEGTNDWRLYRVTGSRLASDGGRVANLRLRNIGLKDPEYRRDSVRQEGMRCTVATADTSVGLSMLAYENESPEDVARWLDWTHGLVEVASVVWTEKKSAPNNVAWADLTVAYGAQWVVAGVEDVDFAAWRNVAIDFLEVGLPKLFGSDVPVTKWHWWVDPDEWVDHPVHDLIPIRRMVESKDRAAWLFRFRNYREAGAVTESATIRLHRLGLGMRMEGRVHESFGNTLQQLQEAREGRAVGTCPIVVHNRGTIDQETGRAKLAKYATLIREELAVNPHSAQHWIGLSWQYSADGHSEHARICLDHAVECAGDTAFLPWFERGMLSIRGVKSDLQQAVKRLPKDHHSYDDAMTVLRSLQGVAEGFPRQEGMEPKPLPDYPGPPDAEI